jgi:hypothetical protein
MMNQGHRAEKRVSSRVEGEFPVTVLEAQVTADNANLPPPTNSYVANAIAKKATGANISQGGLAFVSSKPYRAGTILAFEVVLPEPPPDFLPMIRRFVQRQIRGFRSLCQVVWTGAISIGQYQMGVRFIDTNERRSNALAELLTECQWQNRFARALEEPDDPLSSFDDWGDFEV